MNSTFYSFGVLGKNTQHGVAQQSNVSTVSAPECDLKIMLRNMKEGTYPIQVKSYRKDGTIDIESSEVQATAPF